MLITNRKSVGVPIKQDAIRDEEGRSQDSGGSAAKMNRERI